jgi:hypothetical protein
LTAHGNDCLPLLLLNGQLVSQGTYPDRGKLAEMVGIDPDKAQTGFPLPVIQSGG